MVLDPGSMKENIIGHIRKFVELDPREESELLAFFAPTSYRKKEHLLELDSRNSLHFFVVKGCVRMYFVSSKGVEQTTEFAIEGWWITDHSSYGHQQKSSFAIQAIEDTEVLAIDFQGQERLLERFPKMERYFRLIHRRAHAAAQFRTKYLFDYSREEMYHHFHENFPEFTQRVPQHLLASYLNMTPEYLSGIKGKKRS